MCPLHERSDDTYRGLYYNCRGALAGTRNSSMKLTNAQISTLYLSKQFIKYGVANLTPRQFQHIRLIFCGAIVCVGSEM